MISFAIFFLSIVNEQINFFPPCIFLGAVNLITSLFYKEIQLGLTIFFSDKQEPELQYSQNEVLPLPRSQIENISTRSFSKNIFRALKNPPKLLIQLSSSYFKPVSDCIKQKQRTKSQIVVGIQPLFHRRCNSTNPQIIRIPSLIETNPSTAEMDKCIMCFENACNAVFMDCGHGGLCYECANKLKNESDLCHICRGSIVGILKVIKIPGGILEVINENNNS